MDVLQFLAHHLIILDLLRMTSLLPHLVFPIVFVAGLQNAQPLEQGLDVASLQVIDNLPSGEGFEIADFLGDMR